MIVVVFERCLNDYVFVVVCLIDVDDFLCFWNDVDVVVSFIDVDVLHRWLINFVPIIQNQDL